jgi:hypothetical protein
MCLPLPSIFTDDRCPPARNLPLSLPATDGRPCPQQTLAPARNLNKPALARS